MNRTAEAYPKLNKLPIRGARREGLKAVRQAEQQLGGLRDVEAGILIDLCLSYRAVKGYEEMVSLAKRFPSRWSRLPYSASNWGWH